MDRVSKKSDLICKYFLSLSSRDGMVTQQAFVLYGRHFYKSNGLFRQRFKVVFIVEIYHTEHRHPPSLIYTGCLKKMPHKDMFDFLTLKMLPVALALIKPEKRHLLAPLVKNHLFYMRI